MKTWTWTPSQRRFLYTGSLVEAALHSQRGERKPVGKNYSVDELLEMNGLKARKAIPWWKFLMP